MRIFLYMQDVKFKVTISAVVPALPLGWAFPAFILASYRGEEIRSPSMNEMMCFIQSVMFSHLMNYVLPVDRGTDQQTKKRNPKGTKEETLAVLLKKHFTDNT